VGSRFVRRGIVVALAALVLPGGLVGSPSASAAGVLAVWNMNEGPGATQMLDESGNGITGAIADSAASDGLTTGVLLGTDTVYRWGQVRPNVDIRPGRVIRADDPRLNPGSHSWAISFRYRTSRPYGNIVQKGQAQTKGGQIKFQLPKGQISCMFKGSSGRRSIKTINRYDDNQWHTVRCVRTPTSVTLTVDEGTPTAETRRINGPTGTISNVIPMTVGGKPNCNQDTITCDFFQGDIDWVTVEDLG
jgi:hypothetical protein